MGAYLQGNKVYFTDAVKRGDRYIYADGTWVVSIKSYDLKTKKIKVLIKKLKISAVYGIDSKKVIYSMYDKQGESQYYSYNYKTGKRRKITRESI